MALSGSTIASTFIKLLRCNADTMGAGVTASFIQDSADTDSALSISTTRVGIGTAAPEHDLHIKTAGQVEDGILKVGGSGATLGLEIEYDQAGASTTKITANPTYTNTGALMHICVDGDANANQLVLKGDGNVGIGIADPDVTLEIFDTTAQLKLSYDGSNYGAFQVASDGALTISTVDQAAAEGDIILVPDGNVGIGDTDPDAALTINQGGVDTSIITLKSSDVDHNVTGVEQTDTYGAFGKHSGANGGLRITGITKYSYGGIHIGGIADIAALTAKSTVGFGIISLNASVESGNTRGAVGADGNLVSIAANNTVRFIFDAEGDAHCDGTGGWDDYSDSRLKTDVETIPYGLAEVLQLQPKKFKKASGSFDVDGNVVLEDNAKTTIGFIAQEVKEIIPELIKDIDESESFYSMPYGKFVSILVKAVQELSAKVTALEGEDSSSDTKIAALEAEDVANKAKVATLETEDVANKAKIVALEAKDTEYATTITALTARITALESA